MRVFIRNAGFLAAVFLAPLPAFSAGEIRIDIAVTPKKEAEDKKKKGNVSKEVTKFQYSVKLSSRSFAPATGLNAEYRIFVRDDSGKGAISKQKLTKQSFSATIPDIASNGTYTFITEPVKLESSQLDPDWYYSNGKRSKSADKIAGVWIRILQGDKIVGEYTNPTTLATKEEF